MTTANVSNNSTINTFNTSCNTIDRDADNDQSPAAKDLNGIEAATQNAGSYNAGANNLRGADGKRKKLKSRNIPTTANAGYSRDHLDAWLETCLKDVSQEQLSSSSEFLDYNPMMTTTTTTSSSASKQKQSGSAGNAATNANATHAAFQQHHQQQQSNRNNSKSNSFMTGMPAGYSSPFNQGFQRSMPNFTKSVGSAFAPNRFSAMFSPSAGGFYGPHMENSQDFASLPPIVNLLGSYGGSGIAGNGAGSSEHEVNSTDVLDGSNGCNPNMSRGFRFSDPCLLNPSDNDSKMSGQNTSDRRQNIPSEMENNKFFVALMEQINILHETNSKICRNLHETKVDIEALKHPPTWGGMRHRRDSLSGLSAHSQPMIFGGGFGNQSPAPTYHSGAYTPGAMTDVVREVKEAARVREDAMLNRVKALVEERQWTMNEANLRMMRDIEELKSQINFLRSDRKDTNKRITHLEAENKYMRQLLASIYNANRYVQLSGNNTIYEHETQRSQHRKATMPHAHSQRRSQSLNLHYGTIHHQASSSLSLEEQEEQEPLHIVETPKANVPELKQQQKLQKQPQVGEIRNSFSSSDGSNGATSGDNASSIKPLAMSPPKFALISTPSPSTEKPPLQKPKRKNKDNARKNLSSEEPLKQQQQQQQEQQQEQQQQQLQKHEQDQPRHSSKESVKSLPNTQELQRELNDAVAARQNADERIIAIEKLVRNFNVNATHPNDTMIVLENGDGNIFDNNLMSVHSGYGIANKSSNATTINNCKPHMQQHHHHLRSQQQQNITTSQSRQQQNIINGSNSTSTVLNHASPKLSLAGPITDL